MKNTFQLTRTGSFHTEHGMANQDYMCTMETDAVTAILLTDGATACPEGLKGGMIACQAAMEIIRNEWERFSGYSEEKSAFLMTEHILYYLEENVSVSQRLSDYGSTFIMAVLDKRSGHTRLYNLGDGAVLKTDGREVSYLMQPVKYAGAPCLTVTEGADRAMKVSSADLKPGENIVLCSDGFLEMMNLRDEGTAIRSYMSAGDFAGVKDALKSLDNPDDCSFIALTAE